MSRINTAVLLAATLRGSCRSPGAPVTGLLARPAARFLNTQFRAEDPSKILKLDRPLGVAQMPSAHDNQGVDDRSWKERTDDMKNYQKNLDRREQLTKEFAKGSYGAIYQFRDTAGKFWVYPGALVRSDRALYIPNFWGRTLETFEKSGSTAVLNGKVSIVRVFSSYAGEQQTQSLFDGPVNTIAEDGFQIIDVNLPDSRIKEWLVKLFTGRIRKSIPDASRHSRYFICRKGVTPEMRESIKADNIYGGYVYLVDSQCRIRWACCGTATPEEKANLWKFVRALNNEAKAEANAAANAKSVKPATSGTS